MSLRLSLREGEDERERERAGMRVGMFHTHTERERERVNQIYNCITCAYGSLKRHSTAHHVPIMIIIVAYFNQPYFRVIISEIGEMSMKP